MLKLFYKLVAVFIFNKTKRKQFRLKYIKPLNKLKNIENKLNAIDTNVLSLNSNIENKLNAIDTNVLSLNSNIENKLNAIDTSVLSLNSNIENKLNAIDTNVLSLNSNIENKLNAIEHNIIRNVQRALTTFALHNKTFLGFKNKHNGASIAILGAGPSLNNFIPLKNCLYIKVNKSILYNKVKADYFFAIDKIGVDELYKNIAEYKCIKFIGDQNLGANFQISESDYLTLNARKYITDIGFPSKFALNIDSEPLGNFTSVALQAAQFALYTNPAKLYLVGIDCTPTGHFNNNANSLDILKKKLTDRNDDINNLANWTKDAWLQFKVFASIYYPHTEIISINPVNLKGVFKDEYQ